jgi:hypothetical protein
MAHDIMLDIMPKEISGYRSNRIVVCRFAPSFLTRHQKNRQKGSLSDEPKSFFLFVGTVCICLFAGPLFFLALIKLKMH